MWLARIFKITDKAYLNALSHAGTIGLHMVSGIAVGTLIGWALDNWLESSPWCTGIFMIIGIVAGYKNVYVDTRRLLRSQTEAELEADEARAAEGSKSNPSQEREQNGQQ